MSLLDDRLAELLGVLLGDGCVSRFKSQRKVKTEVAFTGNTSEEGYYRNFLKPLVEEVFHVKGQIRLRPDNTVRLHFRSKKVAEYFLGLGVPLGRRHDAWIPAEVPKKRRLVIGFIRGFYHAEGSIYQRYSRRYSYHARYYGHYLVIQFRCKLLTLMREVRAALKGLGIRPTRMGSSEGVYTFRVTDQSQVSKFMRIVRPRYKTRPSQ